MYFVNAIGESNSFDPDQARPLSSLFWVETVSKDYQQQQDIQASKELQLVLQKSDQICDMPQENMSES